MASSIHLSNKLYSLNDFFNSKYKSIKKMIFILRIGHQDPEGHDFSKSDIALENTQI